VSIAAHAIVIGAIGAKMLITVEFPTDMPKISVPYQLTEAPPPPPPPPPPPAAAKAVPQTAQVQPIQLPVNVAPTIIPETIPIVPPVEPPSPGVDDGITEGIVGGVVGGDPNGVAGGEIGGIIGGVIGGIVSETPGDTVIIPRDESLPMASMSQTYPVYPEEARSKGWEDKVIVRYIIGKDGRVRDVIILSQPQRPIFARETVRAIKNWRFRPMIRNGEAKEVVHELTVNYELEWLQRARAAAKKSG
jgi:protein TonB